VGAVGGGVGEPLHLDRVLDAALLLGRQGERGPPAAGVQDPIEMERLADALPLERAASRWIVSSDPDEQIEKIRPYVELGFRHLVFHAPGPDQARFLRLYSEQVLPKLRALFR
jgi:alkanesulfonate monooxygenase SsuD/methylene tetrahydromethanopterin reductase-like flavin-dependent oxidoreductase (luciferase family)